MTTKRKSSGGPRGSSNKKTTRELLEEVIDYLQRNPPADGWGILDRREDADREMLVKRLYALLDDDHSATARR